MTGDSTGDGPLLPSRSSASFRVRTVEIAAGKGCRFDEAEWLDSIVEVIEGELTVELTNGDHCRFGPGAILWLAGLPVRALHGESLALRAISRRQPHR